MTTELLFNDMDWWDESTDLEWTPRLNAGFWEIYIGIDASVKRDSTAVVTVARDDDAQRVRLIAQRILQLSVTELLDYEGTIEATLREWQSRQRLREVRLTCIRCRRARSGWSRTGC